jgi:hypothetical protein
MSDYIKATNFAAKDVLPSGDPSKIIRGAEIDDEFNAIAGAVSSKRDSTSTVPIANGGTGQTTANAALNALLPSQTGNNGRYLTTNGTNTSWATVVGGVTSVTASTPLASSGGATPNISLTGTVALGNGGTGSTTAAGARTNLGLGSLATLNSASLTSNVTGTLPIGNGGTNLTTYTTGDIIYASASNTLAKRAIGTTGQVLTVSGGVPTWATPTASGDTTGAASSVDNGVVLFSGTGGKTLKSSAAQDGFVYGVRVGRGAGGVSSNTVLGGGALNSNTTGTNNTAVGTSAVRWSTTTSGNTGLGANTLSGSSLSGANNTAVGAYGLSQNTSGSANLAAGYFALSDNTTGANNTAAGSFALESNTTGANNTALGYAALVDNTTASSSTAVGDRALGNSTGQQNTALGALALNGVTTETNCTGLGYNTAVTGSNEVQLGNSLTGTYAYGAVQNRSDARDKADIRDTQLGLGFISALRPVDFKWDYREDYCEDGLVADVQKDGSKKRNRYHHGLIAQEVKTVLDAQGIDFGGYQDHSINGGKDVMSLGYTELIAPMIKAIQELKTELNAVKAELAALK